MVLPGEKAQVELGSIYLEIVLILMQDGCTVAWNIPYAPKSIWTHQMELQDDVCLASVNLDIVLVSM